MERQRDLHSDGSIFRQDRLAGVSSAHAVGQLPRLSVWSNIGAHKRKPERLAPKYKWQQDLRRKQGLYTQDIIFISIDVIVRYVVVLVGQHQTRYFT